MNEKAIVNKVYEIIDKAENREKAQQADDWFTNGKGTPFSLLELGLSESNRDIQDFLILKEAFLRDCLALNLGDYELITHYITESVFQNQRNREVASKGVKNVYVIKMENNTVKIGITNDPNKRFKAIKAASGMKIVDQWISEPTEISFEVERRAHGVFHNYRLHGEYFAVDFNRAIQVVSAMIGA